MKEVETQIHVFTKNYIHEEKTIALNKLFNPFFGIANNELSKGLTIDYLHTGYHPFIEKPILTTYVTYGVCEEPL